MISLRSVVIGGMALCLVGTASASTILWWTDGNLGTDVIPGGIALAGDTAVQATGSADFVTELNAGGWDAVIFGEQSFFTFSGSVETALQNYLAGGGHIIAATWVPNSQGDLPGFMQGTEVDQNGTSITTDASAIFAGLGGTIALTNPGYGTFSQSYAAQAGATGFGSLGGGSAVILGNNGHTYLNGPLFDTYSNVAQGQQLIANELGAFAAPEPSSLLMMGVGLLCLTCMGYRRNVLVVALRNWAPKVATTANRSTTLAR